MDPNIVKRDVIYASNGSESDSKIFQSMVEKAQIDVNSTYAKNIMFTTPKAFYSSEQFLPSSASVSTYNGKMLQRPRISSICRPRPIPTKRSVSTYDHTIQMGVGVIVIAGILLLVFGATRFLQGKTR